MASIFSRMAARLVSRPGALFDRRSAVGTSGARTIWLPDEATIYAVGDVHGCLDELRWLERSIASDPPPRPGPKIVALLGDMIDRGPNSAGVIDHVMSPPPVGIDQRICLMGNHEDMFLSWLDAPDRRAAWIEMGGDETLRSYGIDLQAPGGPTRRFDSLAREVRLMVPDHHITFLRDLPHMARTADGLFVHAGINPGRDLDRQDVRDLLWTRAAPSGIGGAPPVLVVHGHTPVPTVERDGRRINVDTGCYVTGMLSAVRVSTQQEPAVLNVRLAKRPEDPRPIDLP